MEDAEAPDFRTFGSRLKWLLAKANAPEEFAKWLAEEMRARGFETKDQTVRTWTSADEKQPSEPNVLAICAVLRASPAWLRYGVGWPFSGEAAESGAGGEFPPVRRIQLALAKGMGGMSKGEVAAEAVRRARAMNLDRAGMRKLYRWFDEELFDFESKDVVTLEDTPQSGSTRRS